MKTITTIILTTAVALGLIGCGAPANNAPANANANANTAKPAPPAPTADALLSLDKAANEAYFKGDATYFETFLSDKFGWAEKSGHKTKADVLKEVAGGKCDIKEGWKLEDPQMSKIDDDTYGFSYKGTFDGTCMENGKSTKVPSPIRAATVFVRNGDKWQAVWHGEQPMMEPKKDDAAANTAKKDDKAADSTKPSDKADTAKSADAKKPAAEPKKEEKAEAKKEEPKKEEKPSTSMENKPNGATKTAPANATNAAPAAAAGDANTDALVRAELAGWNAWKDHDAKALDSFAAKDLAWVGPGGMWHGTRADVLKDWEGATCKDVKNVNVKDGFAWALSPTVEILTFTSTADGSCDGIKNGTFWGMSVYVKDGDAWKDTFGFLEPAGKM